jgi:hypothetical protein
MATITIQKRAPLSRKVETVEIEADIFGVFAVHRTVGQHVDEDPLFTLTHVPSGYAFLSNVSKIDADDCAHELVAGDVDWSTIAKPSDMTLAHREQGKAMRAKYKDPGW